MILEQVGSVPVDRVERLKEMVRRQSITEHIVRDLEANDLKFHGVIEMDEYTLDLLVVASDGLCLVYDTT